LAAGFDVIADEAHAFHAFDAAFLKCWCGVLAVGNGFDPVHGRVGQLGSVR
jgi:hypothetical protein